MLGGMGMGGGTVLIPALTIIFGVEQQGNLQTEGVWWIVIPAVLTSIAGGLAAALLPAAVLKKLFGAFLVALAIKGAVGLKFPAKK